MNRNGLKLFLLACFVLAVMPVCAAIKYPCQKELNKGQYELALQQIKQLLAKTPKDCKANYAAYMLYTDSLWDGYNPELGYDYLVKSQAAVAKDRSKLERAGYTKDLYKADYVRVGEMLWAEYEQKNTNEAYEFFVNTFKKLPARIKNRAYKVLYEPAYLEAVVVNTEDAYNQYIKTYPKSPYCKLAEARKVLLTAGSDWRKYRDLLEQSKESEVRKFVMQEMYGVLRTTRNLEGLRYGCKFSDLALRDSCLYWLHYAYTETDDIRRLEQFYKDVKRIENGMYDSLQRKDDRIFETFYKFRNNRSYENAEQFVYAAAPYYLAYSMLQELIHGYVRDKNWEGALAETMKFDSCFAGEHRYEQLKQILSRQFDYSVVPQKLPDDINTDEGNEYAPQLSGDGNTLLFCGRNRLDSISGEDVYEAKRVNGVWQSAHPVTELCTDGNDSPDFLSVDGNSLIMFRGGKLYISQKTAEGWGAAEILSANINFCAWQSDPCITSDGRAMLFAARSVTERELAVKDWTVLRSHESFERTNIYVSLLLDDGTWGVPVDLGPTINTSMCDRAPFLHPDMRTLYFCSEGHGGLGGLDVYRARRLREDSWTEWSEPENLGKEINTEGDNCWYIISTDGQTAYYSARERGTRYDLYQLPLPAYFQPDKVATISGMLLNKDGQPLDAEIIWEDLMAHQIVGRSRSNPEDGTFFIVLPKGKIYGYYVDKEGFFPIADNIDLREVEDMVEMKQDITVITYQQMIDEQIPMPLNNLFFPTAQSSLLPESQSELRRMAKIIREIGGRVEISGHTDNVGTDSANQLLSEQRAKAVYDFLINEGCDPDLLQWKGYGKTKPVADNRTESGRQKNRRVELRFIQ